MNGPGDGPFPPNRGQDALCAPDGRPVQVLKWNAELGPGGSPPCHPELVTITLDSDEAATLLNQNTGDLTAIIQWGVGTRLRTMLCDWIRGAQVVLPCTNVTVQAVQRAPDADSVAVNVHAATARRAHPTRRRPTLTERVSVGAASSELVRVPNFARKFFLWGPDGISFFAATVAQGGTVTGLGRPLAIYGPGELALAFIFEGIALQGGAGAIAIANGDAIAHEAVVTFELAV